MKKLTPRYRKRLLVLWTIEVVTIAYNVCAPSFETMALPMAACWLYVIACVILEDLRFERAFFRQYPHAYREWKAGKRGPWCPVSGDPDLRNRWEELHSVSIFAGRVFMGFVALFFVLLGRGLLFGAYP